MGFRKFILFAVLFIILFEMDFSYAETFQFNGTVYDIGGGYLNGTNISVLIKNSTGSSLGYNYTYANATGWFNMSVESNSTYTYQLSLIKFSTTTSSVEWVGQSLPFFSYSQFSTIYSPNFYLKAAGTINITVVNSTNSYVPNSQFSYQVKDQKLGYPVSVCANSGSYSVLCYVPNDRNYSIMVYPSEGSPQHFVPVSFNWNNFSATSSYNISSNNISKYNVTTWTLHKQFNVTESFARLTGFLFNTTGEKINNTNSWNVTEFTIVPFVSEPGNMVFMSYGILPYNISNWTGTNDVYNTTTGFYNITLPYFSDETVNYVLFAAIKNGSTYYGGYRNLTVSGSQNGFNFTIYNLLGINNNITMKNANGGTTVVNTSRQVFNLINSTTNASLSQVSAHIELMANYSNYNSTEITFVEEISSMGNTNFSFPLLNATGVQEINIYSQNFAPKRVSTQTASQIISNNNISINAFEPKDIGGSLSDSSITVDYYSSSVGCDVPNPGQVCSLMSSTSLDSFNPLSAIIGGGALSFRFSYGGIKIHYVNVDMLASGPPDGLFDSVANTSTDGGFSSAMRFGSQGPTIYDYVLVSVPYTEGSSSQSGLDENSQVNLSIPSLYDDNWNVIWNTTSNGTNGTYLAGNYSHYSLYSSQWETLMESSSCVTNVTWLNSTHPCYIDITNNRIWVRLPHFSGVAPTLIGSASTVLSDDNNHPGGGSGSGGGSGASTFLVSNENFNLGYTKSIAIKDKLKFNVSDVSHTLELNELTKSYAIIKVASDPQTATLSVGETKKFELNGDNYYDLSVLLNNISIINNNPYKANITIVSVHDQMSQQEQQSGSRGDSSLTENAVSDDNNSKGLGENESGNKWMLVVIGLIIVVGVICGILFLIKRYKKRKYNGY